MMNHQRRSTSRDHGPLFFQDCLKMNWNKMSFVASLQVKVQARLKEEKGWTLICRRGKALAQLSGNSQPLTQTHLLPHYHNIFRKTISASHKDGTSIMHGAARRSHVFHLFPPAALITVKLKLLFSVRFPIHFGQKCFTFKKNNNKKRI